MDELIYDRIELLSPPYNKDYYNISEFRVTKLNRTAFVIKANIEFLVDLDETFNIEVIFSYNRMNNNQYTRSWLSIKKDTICNAAKKFQHMLITDTNKEKTNLPDNIEGYCPLKKVLTL